ncbi:MAG TPA: hypothetical protein VM165_10350 [Planctomycetaceae bacterium]|nr:hypothetical protein [Planctomycetaceae bacterium]
MSQNADFDAQPAPVKQGSGCLKWVLIFGAIGGVCVLGCCGAMAWFGYQFKPTIVQTSPEVRAMAAEIANFDIPEDFQGKMGMKMDNSFMSMRMCQFEHQTGRGQMQLMEMKVKVGDPKEQEQQLKQQMQQQGAAEMKTLNIVKSETREITIHGQPAQFTFAEGQDASTSTTYHDVQGQFTGKNGIAKLHLQVEDEVWDEEAVMQMLEAAK